MKKIENIISITVALTFGLLNPALILFDWYYPTLLPISSNHLPSGFLSIIIGILGYERFIQKKKTENPISDLLKMGGVKIVQGSVTSVLIEKIERAKEFVRTTSLYYDLYSDDHKKDSYYKKLGEKIEEGSFVYKCVINPNDKNIQSRISQFIKARITDKG